MTVEKGGQTAVEIIALPDHMPQLIDAERQTGSGKAELTAEKDETGMSRVTGTDTAVTDIDTVMTDAAGKTGIGVEIGMCQAADMMTAGSQTEIGTGPASTALFLK